MKRVLAVASGGGHWIQLLRLRPAFEGNELIYMSTSKDLSEMVAPDNFISVKDANQSDKIALLITAIQIFFYVVIYRPNIVLSTGAAPGYFAILFGKIMGAKTIWIDSIANSEEISLAGLKAKRWCDHWLTQWSDLAKLSGAEYWGAVL